MTAQQQTEIEELIMETLIARWRLGENVWPFNHSKPIVLALQTLEEKGWVHWKGGVVEHTLNVFPTVEGIAHFTGQDYNPGMRRDLVEVLTAQMTALRTRVREVAAQLSAEGFVANSNMVMHALGE